MPMIVADSKRIPLADGSVDCVVSSPPYWGLRAYGDSDAELGRGDSLASFVAGLVDVARECRRVLRPDGTMWWNLGDTASGSGGSGGDYNAGGSKDGRRKWKQGESGMARGTWCGVPNLVADALRADGWLVRCEIVWDKGQERRESLSHVRRPRPAHEMVFMLAPAMGYRFWTERLTETGSVWHFPPSSGSGNGDAPFPDELPTRCIAPATEPGDLVLDPFAGSGTTLRAAEAIGRRALGLDLYAGP